MIHSCIYVMAKRSAKSKIDIAISLSDLKILALEEFEDIKGAALMFCFCRSCGASSMKEEKTYETWINSLGDVLWDGHCQTCGSPVTRYLETGEKQDFFDRAMTYREMKIEVMEDYVIRKPPQRKP